jgi:hypothetical protein
MHMKKFLKTQLTVAAVLAGALALGTGCKSDHSATRGDDQMPATDTTGTGTDTTGTGTTTTPPPSSGGSGFDTSGTSPDNTLPPADSSGTTDESAMPPSTEPGTGGAGTSEAEPGVHDGEMTEPGTGGSGLDPADGTLPDDSLPNDSKLDPNGANMKGDMTTPTPDSTGTLAPNNATTR